jgi:DNA-binding IclR family transcriptional regulator
MKDSTMRSRHFINSLEKAFMILNTFNPNKQEQTISEIADICKMAIGSVHRYLFTLKELGYIQQNPETKKYNLSLKNLHLAFIVLKGMDLRKRVLPYMIDATRLLEVNTQCAILDGGEIVYIERVRSKSVVDLDIGPGFRLPVHVSAMGKVLLAYEEDNIQKDIIKKMEFKPLTQYSITNKKLFYKKLQEIKKVGYAISDKELNEGVFAVAAPIFKENRVEAAVGLSFSVQKANEPGAKENLIKKVLEISKNVSL